MQDQPPRRHPALAAVLSFLFPGLGQAYAGFPRLAAILAAPVVLLIVGGAAAALFDGAGLRNLTLSSQFLFAVLVLDLALLAWRLFAIAHAGLARHAGPRPAVSSAATGAAPPTATARGALPASRRRTAVSLGIVGALLLATVGMHAWAALVVNQLNSSLNQVFTGGNPVALPSGQATGTPAPLNQPDYRWNGTDRINFLLLGIDSGPMRSEALTDTIMVVSIDPVKHTAFMVSVPRDTGYVPLPDRTIFANGRYQPNGAYPGKINEITTVADQNPRLWCPDLPTGANCGLRTLERVVGLYLGIPIQYYATIDLVGFAEMINALGGVRLCLPGKLVDPTYGGPTWYPKVGITLPAGCSNYDGAHALAYARSRKGYIVMPDGTQQVQDDFKRAARQQEVLLALRDRIASANLIFALPSFLKAIGDTVATDFPRSLAGDLASLAPDILGTSIQRVVLGLPEYVDPPAQPLVNYLLIPKPAAIRAEMLKLLGPGATLQGWYMAGDLYPPAVAAPSPEPTASP
jgi:LCP family protein required for cell wall assembly